MNTLELINRFPNIDDETRQLLISAISTRGKYKGYLLSSPPNIQKNPDGWLAWQAIISNIAPARVSLFSLMMLTVCFNVTEPSMRWNLYAMRHDVETEQGALDLYFTEKGF